MEAVLNSTVPLVVLVAAGYLARRFRVLKPGDERVLNAYVYWFALPALFVFELAQTVLTPTVLRFMGVGLAPVLGVAGAEAVVLRLARVPRTVRYLVVLSTVFGSLAFFGIPFVEFSLGGEEPVRLASLATAGMGPVTVGLVLFLLEAHRVQRAHWGDRAKAVGRRLARNPLILSIFLGFLLSAVGWNLPGPVGKALRLLGTTTAPVALFTLGVFFYGRPYRHLLQGLALSLPRLVLLPAATYLAANWAGLSSLEASVLVLLNGTPLAVNTVVLSQRYRFHEEALATAMLVSSLGAMVTLNLWRWVLGLG